MSQQTTTHRNDQQSGYAVAFVLLAIFTGLEVGIYYLDALPDSIKMTLWVILAAAKVALVLLFFMHLKSDSRVFDIPIGLALVLIVPLILIVTLTMPQSSQAQGSTGSSSGGGGSSGSTSVDVTETSFNIKLSTDSAPPGQVTFHVSNQADAVPHQLTVIKTDKAPGQLPTSNGKVDLSNLNVIGQTDNIQTGQSQDLSVNLEAGSYVLICNIPSHYSNGMYAGFTVGGGGSSAGGNQSGGSSNGGSQAGTSSDAGASNNGSSNNDSSAGAASSNTIKAAVIRYRSQAGTSSGNGSSNNDSSAGSASSNTSQSSGSSDTGDQAGTSSDSGSSSGGGGVQAPRAST